MASTTAIETDFWRLAHEADWLIDLMEVQEAELDANPRPLDPDFEHPGILEIDWEEFAMVSGLGTKH